MALKHQTRMALKQFITNQTNVGLEITKQLLQTELKDKNMVYSPLSIYMVLSLVAAGKTGSNLEPFLSFLKAKSVNNLNSLASHLITRVLADGSAKGGPSLHLANGLWTDESEPLDDSYRKVACKSYQATLKQVDIKANPEKVRVEVNSWVKEETKGLITDILSPNSVTHRTKSIMASALYLKASWNVNYNFRTVKKNDYMFGHEFHLLNGESIKGVTFMTSRANHLIKSFNGFKVLKLMYHSGDEHYRRGFSMCLLLPDATDGLPALAERVCSEPGFIDSHLNTNLELVEVGEFLIPKFKFSSSFGASEILEILGVADNARLVHKAMIEVDEKGATAAAASVYWEEDEADEPDDEEPEMEMEDFVADHPFMFVIQENRTRTVLFMGHVLNPLEG